MIVYNRKGMREWKVWFEDTNVDVVFLKDNDLQTCELADFKYLLMIMGK